MQPTPVSPLHEIARATARDLKLIAAQRGAENDMGETPDKLTALLDTLRALDTINAPHALIGGVAVGIHAGVPRATVDTDIAVLSTCDRSRISRVMTDAGFRLVGEHPHSVNFRHSSGEPVRLAFDAAFDRMIEQAEVFQVGASPVPIVRKQDLITMKRRAAADPERRRSKALRDQADVELLLGDIPDPDEGW